MPTDKPRFTITMDEELYRKIEDFKFQYRYKNQTQAVLALIDMGIESIQAKMSANKDGIATDEFDRFQTFIKKLGYVTHAEGDHYRLCNGNQSVAITAEELRTLVRTSDATVGALAREMMEREKTPSGE